MVVRAVTGVGRSDINAGWTIVVREVAAVLNLFLLGGVTFRLRDMENFALE